MISKYAKKVLIKKNIYAVFNSFIMDVLFMEKDKVEDLFNSKYDAFSEEELKLLHKCGIIIKSKEVDNQIIQEVHKTFKNYFENKVSLMYIIPTNTCNLACKYCFIGKLKDKQEQMTFDVAKKAVDMFHAHLKNIDTPGTIIFYGGEPLINYNLIKEIVDYSNQSKYKFNFSMVSNGLLLNEEKVKFIKENNISIGISIDGPKSITDANRVYKDNKTGIYDDLVKKIDLLKKAKVDFSLSITLTPAILKEQDIFLDWLINLDIKSLSYNLLHYTYKTNEWKRYYKDAVKFLYKSNNLLFNKGFDEDRINRKYKSFFNREFKYSDCAAVGANQITVCPNGDLEICHGYWNSKNHSLGNIKDINKIEDLFTKEGYNEWKEYKSINKRKCLNCPAIYICGGGCAMQAKDLFDSHKSVDKAFCIYSKGMLKYILKEVYNDSISK